MSCVCIRYHLAAPFLREQIYLLLLEPAVKVEHNIEISPIAEVT